MNSRKDNHTVPMRDNPIMRLLAAAPFCAAVVVSAISALVIVGWSFEIDFLKRIIPGYVFMNPTTAVAFVLSSVALWLLQSQNTARIRLAQICAAIVSLVGLIQLCELIGFFEFGIDRMLFRDHLLDTVTGKLNRMAPNSALNFFLLGAALLLYKVNTKRAFSFPAQYPALLVILTSFVAIIGYLYGAASFYLIVSFNPMAIHTAVSFLLLAGALLLSKPEQGIIKEIFSPHLGGQTARRLFPLFVIVPVILGWLRLYGEKKGFFGPEMGTALLIVIIIIVLSAIITYNARLTNNAAVQLGQTKMALNNSSELLQLLGDSEENYRQLANAMPQIVWTARPDGVFDYYNERWFDYTGTTPDKTASWESVLHPDDFQNRLEIWNKSIKTGEKFTIETRLKRASDGAYHWHLGQALPVRDAENRIVKWIGTCTDIHEQKKVEEELRQIREELESRVERRTSELSVTAAALAEEIGERKIVQENLRVREERFQLATQATSDVVWDWDLTTDNIWWNQNFQTMFGYSKDEIGTEINSWTDRLHPDDLQRIDASVHDSIENKEQSWAGEYRFRRRDGSYAFIADRGHIVYDESGKPSRMIGSMMDITERNRVDEELKDFAARLERSNNDLQEFASVASHDLQEPLRKVQAFGDRLKTKCGDALNEDGRDYLERMQNAAGRMQTLINDLLSFSRVSTQIQPFLPVNLRQVADEVLSDLETRIETTCGTIEIGELATIDADPTQMRQLLQNLISNALKFSRPGVPPIVKISGQICHKPAENEETSRVATFCLTVEDNGIGFEEKYNDRIFKVFQRLHGRSEYEGTGIGLAVCRKIAVLHGGDITVRSIPNQGTIFTVNLPLVQREKAQNE